MFPISKEEANSLDKNFPNKAYTVCSMRKSCGGKTYWCYENEKYKAFIKKMHMSANMK